MAVLSDILQHIFNWRFVMSGPGVTYEGAYLGCRVSMTVVTVSGKKKYSFARQRKNQFGNGKWDKFDTAQELFDSFPRIDNGDSQ